MKAPWFTAKSHGLGLTPAGLSGWLCTAVFVTLDLALVAGGEMLHLGRAVMLATLGGLILGFMVLAWLTSDRRPLRWRWGKPD